MNGLSMEKIQDTLCQLLPFEKSYDLIKKELTVENTPALLLCINGFVSSDVQQQVISGLINTPRNDNLSCQGSYQTDIHALAEKIANQICFAQVSLLEWPGNLQQLCTAILSGPMVLIMEGQPYAIIIDVRSYYSRSITEPESEKISGGAKDGFVESLMTNTALIRRRIRDKDLIFSHTQVGYHSHTDVIIAYKESIVDKALLKKIMTDLSHMRADDLTMGAESLAELLLPKKWWSPLPSFRFTARPDVACSFLEEGYILLLVDNTPQAIVLPCSLFQFTQSPQDYCKAPLAGTYSRWIRFLCIPLNLILLPLFLLLTVYYPEYSLEIGLLAEPLAKPRLIFYTFAAEFLLNLFKHSTEQSDSRNSGTLSIIGGLIIGDMAINMHWVSPEILFYAGFTLLTSLSLPSTAFADALRTYRIILLTTTSIWGLPGFIAGIGISLLSAASTPVYGSYSYLWPLLPFNWSALKSLLFRYPTIKKQPPKPH